MNDIVIGGVIMEFLSTFNSDKGNVRRTNQDSLCIKVASTTIGNIAMGVVCDGMGGLTKGELASATVIKAFAHWFDNVLPNMIGNLSINSIRESWSKLIKKQNKKLIDYGASRGINIGTTITAMLIVDDDFWVIAHVGDSRAYRIKDNIEMLTEDQTVVQLEVRRGKLTPEEAEYDSRNNLLLQCCGCFDDVTPIFSYGNVDRNCVYMLCSDGFRHRITPGEMHEFLNPVVNYNENIMQINAMKLVELNKFRKEDDNISVLLIRTA